VNTTLAAKLKLLTTPDQFMALRATQLAYRDALNFVSGYAFAHGKTSNQQRLQRDTYPHVRSQFGRPAQMACNVPRQVSILTLQVRTLVIRQAWMTTGQLSVAPDVTDQEAKAARLKKYAELRWSPATSSSPSRRLSY
jgi:predicted transposase